MELSLSKKNTDIPNLATTLISHLDMILTLLKKTTCDPQETMTDYIDKRKNILGQHFPVNYLPSPESRLKVCHIVSLHELLEEMCSERVIGSLNAYEEYSVDLEPDIEDHLKKMALASTPKAEIVLKALKRFIYRCIIKGDISLKHELIQFLSHESFWSENVFVKGKLRFGSTDEDIRDVIPPDIQVCHVVNLAILLNNTIQNKRKDNQRVNRKIAECKRKNGGGTITSARYKRKLKRH